MSNQIHSAFFTHSQMSWGNYIGSICVGAAIETDAICIPTNWCCTWMETRSNSTKRHLTPLFTTCPRMENLHQPEILAGFITYFKSTPDTYYLHLYLLPTSAFKSSNIPEVNWICNASPIEYWLFNNNITNFPIKLHKIVLRICGWNSRPLHWIELSTVAQILPYFADTIQ